jgi:hypothetical protein
VVMQNSTLVPPHRYFTGDEGLFGAIGIFAGLLAKRLGRRDASPQARTRRPPRYERLSCFADGEHLQEFPRRSGGRRRILPGDQPAVDDRKTFPIGCLLIQAADSLQFLLYEKRDDLGE